MSRTAGKCICNACGKVVDTVDGWILWTKEVTHGYRYTWEIEQPWFYCDECHSKSAPYCATTEKPTSGMMPMRKVQVR